MPIFFDLLKYAATGIASPDMTHYDKMRALAIGGGFPVNTIEGVPPISFTGDGKPLISVDVLGNARQTGTPSPQNIIMPDLVGVRTGNLYAWPYTSTWGVDGSGQNRTVYNSAYTRSSVVKLKPNTQYTLSAKAAGTNDTYCRIAIFDEKPQIGSVSTHYYFSSDDDSTTFTTGADEEWGIVVQNNAAAANTDLKRMLNEGTTAMPYVPYGYAINITNASQTVPVYLGQTVTTRRVMKLVFDGTESWNRSTSGNNTRVYTPQIPECMSLSPAICTHFNYNVTNVGYPRIGDFVINSSKAIIFGVNGSEFEDTTAWEAYLQQQYAAGTPVTVWYVLAEPTTGIVNEPLCKIGDYADELSSTDAGIIIPTAKGENVLTVDTDLQPSSVSITGHIKP